MSELKELRNKITSAIVSVSMVCNMVPAVSLADEVDGAQGADALEALVAEQAMAEPLDAEALAAETTNPDAGLVVDEEALPETGIETGSETEVEEEPVAPDISEEQPSEPSGSGETPGVGTEAGAGDALEPGDEGEVDPGDATEPPAEDGQDDASAPESGAGDDEAAGGESVPTPDTDSATAPSDSDESVSPATGDSGEAAADAGTVAPDEAGDSAEADAAGDGADSQLQALELGRTVEIVSGTERITIFSFTAPDDGMYVFEGVFVGDTVWGLFRDAACNENIIMGGGYDRTDSMPYYLNAGETIFFTSSLAPVIFGLLGSRNCQ